MFSDLEKPRVKDCIWKRFDEIAMGYAYDTLRSELGVDRTGKLSFWYRQLIKWLKYLLIWFDNHDFLETKCF